MGSDLDHNAYIWMLLAGKNVLHSRTLLDGPESLGRLVAAHGCAHSREGKGPRQSALWIGKTYIHQELIIIFEWP